MSDDILRWFESGHLKPELRFVVDRYRTMAYDIATNMDPSAERTVAIRKLLESKDAAVRAFIMTQEKIK